MTKKKIQIVNSQLDGIPEIMLNGDIGSYDGEYFAQRILNIDSEMFRIRINSFGGSVLSGFSIVSAMQSYMNNGGVIETVNEGRADSTAGWIFSCGTRGKRKIMQFAGTFSHPPLLADGQTLETLPEGSEEKEMLLDYFDKLINIFVSCTGRDYMEIKSIMVNETEMNASEAVMNGFADEVVKVDNMPKIKKDMAVQDIVNFYSSFKYKVVNTPETGQTNKNQMKEIAKLLNLQPEASNEAIEGAIRQLLNKVEKNAEVENSSKALKVKNEQLEAEVKELKNQIQEANDKVIIDYVDELIKSDETKKEKRDVLINMAKQDFETFKSLHVGQVANIAEGLEHEGSEGSEGAEDDELKNAKKFAEMTNADRIKLQSENYNEFSKLANAYDKNLNKLS